MKISSKFIQICSCSHKLCHAYCTTAFVLRNQKIFCRDCYSYFRLYVKSERVISSEYIGSIIRLFLLFLIAGCIIYGLYEVDNILKVDAKTKEVQSMINNGEISYQNLTALDQID